MMSINLIMNNNEEPMLRVVNRNDGELQLNYIILTSGFNINKANDVLKSFDTGIEVEFKNFIQYNELVQNINSIVS